MKKFFLIALVALFVTVLPVTAVNAACAPGCDCTSGPDGKGVWGMQQRYAEALRVRNKGWSQQAIKKKDTSLGMTCFDKALGLTSRLGTIFSDVLPSNGNAPSMAQVFNFTNTSQNMGLGAGKMLGSALGNMIGPGIQSHVANFGDTAGAAMGFLDDLISLQFLTDYTNYLDSTIDSVVQGPMQQVNGYVNTVNSTMRTIQQVLGFLNNLTLPSWVTGTVAAVNAAWQVIQGIINGGLNMALSAVMAILQPLIQNILGNLTGFTGPKACDVISKLYKRGGAMSMIGKGIDKGMKYFNMDDLLRTRNIAGAGQDFMDAIGVNSPILDAAWRDLANGGPLQLPGNTASWPTVPILPNNMSVQDIINRM